MPTVSIIVPIYNVELYLEKCVHSLINQTLTDIEIILVNDGSFDSCAEICERLAGLDNRIKVIHKKNGGLSSARNEGLKVAKGKYIGFVDSDDWVEPYMFQSMVENAEQNNSDLVVCAFRTVYHNEVIHRFSNLKNETIDLEKMGLSSYILNYIIRFQHSNSVWNKLYKRCVIEANSIKFEPNNDIYAEDLLFNLYYFCHIKLISTVPLECINYLQRPDSLSSFPESVLYRLTKMVNWYENYAIKRQNLVRLKKIIPTMFCAQIVTSLIHFRDSNNYSYVHRNLSYIKKSKKFKWYSWRILFNKDCSTYLEQEGYSFKARLYFRFTVLMLMLGQNSFVIKKLIKLNNQTDTLLGN